MMDFRPDPSRFQIGQELKATDGFAVRIASIDFQTRSIVGEVSATEPTSQQALPIGTQFNFIPCRISRCWLGQQNGFSVTIGGPPLSGIRSDEVSPPISDELAASKLYCG